MMAGYKFPDTSMMTAQQVAEAFLTTPHHVYHLAKTNVLPSVRLGRLVRFPTAEMKRVAMAETEKPASAPTETGFPETKTGNLRNGLSGQQEA